MRHNEPGKFERSGRLGERMYAVAQNGGADDEIGSVQDHGWFGMLRFRRASVLVHEDTQGFFYAEVYSHDGARRRWDSIVRELEYMDDLEELIEELDEMTDSNLDLESVGEVV